MRKTVKGLLEFLVSVHPIRLVVLGYISYMIIGWFLLSLPVARRGAAVGGLDNLFTATSAVSTTGLVTASTGDDYSLFGQIVIIILIQLGGIGYMTFSSFVILSRKKPLSDARTEVANVIFSLPASFEIKKFIKDVVLFTVIIEGVGAVVLYSIFRRLGVAQPLWSGIFHSISSFCTAGFSLYNNSFESYVGCFELNLTVAVLSYLGAVGFIVFVDVWRRMRNKVNRVTLTTKIILHTTFWVSLAGMLMFFITEPSIRALPLEERLTASFFQAMTAMTTVGFNTINISAVSRASLLLITVLMVIGASPAGTGGGIKSTTFSALIGIVKSALKGESTVYFWRRPIPEQRVRLAMATFCFYVGFLLVGTFFLTLTDSGIDFERILFEAASALGTVGLSTGITSTLSSMSKLIVVLLMFVGRLGPLTFGIALFLKKPQPEDEQEDDLAI